MNTRTPIAVCARRWFDGANTYHSVRVVFDDGTEACEPFEYGYGDAWLTTAGILCGADSQSAHRVLRDLRESGRVVAVDVVDVRRRRDLHNAGRAMKDGAR